MEEAIEFYERPVIIGAEELTAAGPITDCGVCITGGGAVQQ
jgi:hypothetical protein